MGGRVDPLYAGDELPAWYDERLASYLSCIDWSVTPRFLREGEWVVGANIVFRRSVFDTYGMFDVNLGRRGAASLLSNEETALLARLGIHRVFYDPAARVQHVIPVERLTRRWFRRRVYWQAISDLVAGHVRDDDPCAPARIRRDHLAARAGASQPQCPHLRSRRPRDVPIAVARGLSRGNRARVWRRRGRDARRDGAGRSRRSPRRPRDAGHRRRTWQMTRLLADRRISRHVPARRLRGRLGLARTTTTAMAAMRAEWDDVIVVYCGEQVGRPPANGAVAPARRMVGRGARGRAA